MSDKDSTEQTGEAGAAAPKPESPPRPADAVNPPVAPNPAAGTQPAPTARKPRGGKGLWLALALTLGVALAAASAAGLLWWELRRSGAAMARAESAAALSVAEIRGAVESLEEDVGALRRSDSAQLESSGRLSADVDGLSVRFEALRSRVDDFQGVSGDARRRWLMAEAENYLRLGHAELSLGGRWETATAALELADDALRRLGEPAFAGVRRQISLDLRALRSAELVDAEGLSQTLGRLVVRVDELPMGPASPGNLISGPRRLEDVEPGWNRVWLSVRGAIAGMISVERGGAAATPALTAREQSLIRRQLELELEMARLGLLRNQPQVFRAAVETAAGLLTRHFDGSEQAVRSAVNLLEDMALLDVAPAPPDIGGSLSLLRELVARDG